MIKKLFSHNIVKLTTSILSCFLCMGCLSSNNVDAMHVHKSQKMCQLDLNKKREKASKPKKSTKSTKQKKDVRISFNSLEHICDGFIKEDKKGNIIGESGGHLHKYETFDKKYLKDKNTAEDAKEHLRKKTYFSKSIDKDVVCEMVNRALDNLEHKGKGKGKYRFIVDVGGGSTLGSEGEKHLQVNVKRDRNRKLYCASAYPVEIDPRTKPEGEIKIKLK